MKKLLILSALAFACVATVHAKPGAAGGAPGAAGAPDSNFGQSTAGTAKAGNMNGKTQSSAAQMQHPQDGDNHGKHRGDTKGKHTGGKDEKREKKTDDGKK